MTAKYRSIAKPWWTPVRPVVIILTFLGLAISWAATAEAGDSAAASALRSKYDAMQEQLQHNPYGRPLHMTSAEATDRVAGDVYALIKHSFNTVGASLNKPDRWCDIMMLHINTKFCRASGTGSGSRLKVNIGKKHDQAVDDAYPVDFAYNVDSHSSDYLKVLLTADAGPLSTRDYRVVLEAIPLGNNETFIHLTYSYAYGVAGRLAMQTYLKTIGSGKVGFTVVEKSPQGDPVYIGGMRGLVERNTMRYYLAIEAYLSTLSAPPQTRIERSLHHWFASVEQYPRQLRELKQDEYVSMKRREFARLKKDV